MTQLSELVARSDGGKKTKKASAVTIRMLIVTYGYKLIESSGLQLHDKP